jgi:hypothetical protein
MPNASKTLTFSCFGKKIISPANLKTPHICKIISLVTYFTILKKTRYFSVTAGRGNGGIAPNPQRPQARAAK